MRYAFIQAEKAQYPGEVLCRVMAGARSGFSASCHRPASRRAQQNQVLRAQIEEPHRNSDGSDGSLRIHQALRTQGWRVSPHRMARLMRLHGIRGVCRRRTAWRGRPVSPAVVAANGLQRDFIATQPNQKWAGDITAGSTRAGWLSLAVLGDLSSRRSSGGARGTCSITRIAVANTRHGSTSSRSPSGASSVR